ncbi:MAG: aminopeptidase N [Pseudomonadota bacterium]
MRDAKPSAIYLKDYSPPDYLVEKTDLVFELWEDHALVHSLLAVHRQCDDATGLQLHGEELELVSLAIDGEALSPDQYKQTDAGLEIPEVPASFQLQCTTRIRPQDNTSLNGLYKSQAMFCTQCEAHGFRRITFYLDRPDVMSVFSVRVIADQARYPVLLSNGNLVETEQLADGRHAASWHDPHPKPAYLFALVAGDLKHVEDVFTTNSSREVRLRIYVDEKDIGKCDHAMASLKRAMRWDEDEYGREYDLDLFNIVAVDDFNMGAMENKGLNIFNSSCVLCTPETTTDRGFQKIEAIVAHEYFHNWSGNRVTCRDWFQLSLKEGFTVFRDATFSADMGSATVKRIEEAGVMRTEQFAEDAGPMAHPVRPESVIEINNFYTLTVYEKGAEIVRMIRTLIGPAAFRRGSDLYFERHDGQAVTCEDFVLAMEEASGIDLTQFRLWYSQAGTPLLKVRDEYEPQAQRYTLHVEQSCPATPGQDTKQPMLIPLAMGLLGNNGNIPLRLATDDEPSTQADATHRVLLVGDAQQSYVFENIPERPVPSLLRGFSAPVRLDYAFDKAALCALMQRDADGYVRWDSAQSLAVQVIHDVQQQLQGDAEPQVDALLTDACLRLLGDTTLDPAMVAAMLSLPSEAYLAEIASHRGGIDVDGIHRARTLVQVEVAKRCQSALQARYEQLASDSLYAPDAQQIADRALRNVCLHYLSSDPEQSLAPAAEQFETANNMTDRLAALRAIAFYADDAMRDDALAQFYADWQHDSLVMNQWFAVQAAIPRGDTLARVRSLMDHPGFDRRNPNKVYSLIGVFADQNFVHFHRADGEGYRFLADVVAELDRSNPQVASRVLEPLTRWHHYIGREHLMCEQLRQLSASQDLSPDVFELVSKSLDSV